MIFLTPKEIFFILAVLAARVTFELARELYNDFRIPRKKFLGGMHIKIGKKQFTGIHLAYLLISLIIFMLIFWLKMPSGG